MRNKLLLTFSGMLGAGLLLAVTGSTGAKAENEPVYEVQGGRVDLHTFNGYRRYGESCLRCHGPDGAGSSYAPNLTESLKHLSYDDVVNVITNGRQNVTKAQNNVMPAFGTTEDVILYIDDIYGYLKARSDEKLPRGRPKRIGGDS